MAYELLFSASIALSGFTVVFLVFRYQIIDIYVDSRKNILRELLKREIMKDSCIQVKIQDIGKYSKEDDIKYFSRFNKKAVNKFVDDVLRFRRRRKNTLIFGLILISAWGILSLIYIYQYYVQSCYHKTIHLFLIFMILSLFYFFYALWPRGRA